MGQIRRNEIHMTEKMAITQEGPGSRVELG
jgi:hypothetical protein